MFRPCCLILFIAGMFVNLGYAQSNFGRISGTVADSSGASIAGATVTANNTGTGGKQSVKSDSSGNFAFPPLEAGTYTVAVEQQGFKTSQQTGVVLDAASTRSLTFQMVLGTVTESVEVAAAVQQVDTTSGSVGSVITGQQVSQIALNGREYIQLLRLAPGTVSTTLNVFNPQLATNQQAINGVRSGSTYFKLIDCDSFEITDGRSFFPCLVGVPTYTPRNCRAKASPAFGAPSSALT